jgi:hypothetical protein
VVGREGHGQALREALVERDEGLRQRRVVLAREARFREIRGCVEQLRS